MLFFRPTRPFLRSRAILASLALLAFARSARAILVASEPFNYPAGGLQGQNGGTGWNQTPGGASCGALTVCPRVGWYTSSQNLAHGYDNPVAAGSLTWSSGADPLAATGNRLFTEGVPAGTCAISATGCETRSFRWLDMTNPALAYCVENGPLSGLPAYGKPGCTLWLGYLGRLAPGVSNNFNSGHGGFHLYDGICDVDATDPIGCKPVHEVIYTGDRASASVWMTDTTCGNPTRPNCQSATIDMAGYNVGTTIRFIAVRMVFNATSVAMTMWVDPPLGATPTGGQSATFIESANAPFHFNLVEVGSFNTGSQERLDLDEFRIGTTFADVSPEPAVSLAVSGFPSPVNAGTAGGFSVAALDRNNAPTSVYAGTVHFSSNDGAAQLPPDAAFAAGDLGAKNFTAILNSPGTRTLTATDTVTGTISGTQGGIVVNGGCAPPGEATALFLSGTGSTALSWSPPASGGGGLNYDVLRAALPSDFVTTATTACVASGITGTNAVDPAASGFYLVRAQTNCGGALGYDSGGQPEVGRSCP